MQSESHTRNNLDLSGNTSFIMAVVSVLYIPSMMISYALCYHNLLTDTFNEKFGWA